MCRAFRDGEYIYSLTFLQPCPCHNVARKLWLERRHPLPVSWCRLIAAENNCSNRNASITEQLVISSHLPFFQHLGNAQKEAMCLAKGLSTSSGPQVDAGVEKHHHIGLLLVLPFLKLFLFNVTDKNGLFWDIFYNLVMYLFNMMLSQWRTNMTKVWYILFFKMGM